MAKVAKRRGRYVLDYYDATGRRIWKTLPEGTTLKSAKDALREIETKLARGVYLPEGKTPTFETLAAEWMQIKRQNVRTSTASMYEGHLKNHFSDLNRLPITRITVRTAEKFIAAKRAGGMNLGTLKKVIVTFNQVMGYAVRHRYIDHNPVRDAERPRSQGEVEGPKIQVLSIEQIDALVKATIDPMYKMLFRLAVTSGARQGELVGLKWKDIDFEGSQIEIQRTYNNGKWFMPKSKSSRRRIDIGPHTMAELRRWRLACPPNELGLVFPAQGGGPLNHSVLLRKHFWPTLKKSKLPRIRFHDLRHSYASLLIDQGENIKYIQKQMGHADPTITLKIYAHLMRDSNPESACKLEEALFFESGSKMVAAGGAGEA